MKRILLVGAVLLALSPPAGANALHDMQDHIGVDRFAHAGCSYLIADQLHRHGMNRFWSAATTLAIGAAKEAWVDDHWDSRDFAADCAGVLMVQVKF